MSASAPPVIWPTTALGALLGHITGGADADIYQPMNVNFGLFPPIEGKVRKAERKGLYTSRARTALAQWINESVTPAKAGVSASEGTEPVLT